MIFICHFNDSGCFLTTLGERGNMRRIIVTALALLAATVSAAPAVASVSLQTNASGQLTGATGVDVGGTLYDVTFLGGSCNSLFNGCSTSAFAFTDLASASVAAQALLDQVFLGVYDDNPGLTFGCAGNGGGNCEVLIPYAPGVTAIAQNIPAELVNVDLGNDDYVGTDTFSPSFETAGSVTYARFTLSAAAVPEPSTWAMMLVGFFGIGAALRRQRMSFSSPV